MEISQISSNMPFLFPNSDREVAGNSVKNLGDKVDVRALDLIPDEEVEDVLNDTISMIGSDRAAALSVHSGLSESRVFALLGL